jgi:uncharacterized protein
MNYMLKLIPPRATFAQDMSPEERAVMQQHLTYWTDLMNEGIAIVFGPVLDPKGAYGLGIVEVETEEQLRALTENDPAARINTYEAYPMMAVTRKSP